MTSQHEKNQNVWRKTPGDQLAQFTDSDYKCQPPPPPRSPTPAWPFFRTPPSIDRLGSRAGFPRKEERKRGKFTTSPEGGFGISHCHARGRKSIGKVEVLTSITHPFRGLLPAILNFLLSMRGREPGLQEYLSAYKGTKPINTWYKAR